jgi:hypothetical protein
VEVLEGVGSFPPSCPAIEPIQEFFPKTREIFPDFTGVGCKGTTHFWDKFNPESGIIDRELLSIFPATGDKSVGIS